MAAATTMTSRRLFALAAVFVLAVCCLPAAAAAAAAPQGSKQYRVGGKDGWRVPPPENKDRYYDTWSSNITFYVGDTLEFVYKNDSVLRVSKAGYYHCNETAGDAAAAPRDGRAVFLLDGPGYAYFASADLQHCGMGERLAVSVVLATAPPAPSPTSWSSSAPGPWSWVLSPSSTSASAPAASSPSGEHSAAAPLLAASSAHAVVLVEAAVALAAGFV